MHTSSQPPEIFDRQRRYALRQRANRRSANSFLWDYLAQEMEERLAIVSREFTTVLFIGPVAHYAPRILANRKCDINVVDLVAPESLNATEAEEDHLPFEPQSFDLVIAAGTLDSVNDLPGSLVQIRRILKPDGLFLGHMFGAGSLPTLKSLLMSAEGPVATAHVHPQIDLRSAADLLSRAGFALPVADSDILPVRYGDWRTLVNDLRDAGVGNALAGPRRFLGRDIMATMDNLWRERGERDQREEQFAHLFLSGWAPSADQPKPAKRGSGEVSLASILRPAKKD